MLSAVRGNKRVVLGEVYESVIADLGDNGVLLPESDKSSLLGQPDAQAARNAGVSDTKAAEGLRTNQSDGSLKKYAGLAEQRQTDPQETFTAHIVSLETAIETMMASIGYLSTQIHCEENQNCPNLS